MSKEAPDCKCRRIGDYRNGSHHPLCDANWNESEKSAASESAYQRGYLDGMAKGRASAELDAAETALHSVAHSRDAIERSKPILEAVDTYLRRPDRMNRNALRGMIFDEFEELIAASKNDALLRKLLSHAWEFDVKWNKEPNTIRRIVIDVRETATAGQHHIDHAKALIAEFCKTADAGTEAA